MIAKKKLQIVFVFLHLLALTLPHLNKNADGI